MKAFLKKLRGWRTMVISFLIMLVGFLQSVDLAVLVSPEYMGVTLLVLGLVMAILRWMTTTPWGEK